VCPALPPSPATPEAAALGSTARGIGAFLEEVRRVCRLRHLSIHTEDSYVQTIRRFILFHGKRHSVHLGRAEVREYLSHLAVECNVAASTRNVALNTLVFL